NGALTSAFVQSAPTEYPVTFCGDCACGKSKASNTVRLIAITSRTEREDRHAPDRILSMKLLKNFFGRIFISVGPANYYFSLSNANAIASRSDFWRMPI